MCYYRQHACLFVSLSVSQTSMDDSGHKSSGCAVGAMTQASVCQSQSKLSQNHLTLAVIQPSVIASNRCVRG